MSTEIPCATCGPERTFDDPADCPTCAGSRLDYKETSADIRMFKDLDPRFQFRPTTRG